MILPPGWKQENFLDVVEDATKGNPKVLQSDYLHDGVLPVIDQGKSLVAGYVDDSDLAVSGSFPVIAFGDHTKAFKFVDFPFALGADGVKVLRPKKGDDPKYLFYAIQRTHFPDAGYSRHFKFLKESTIPLPPLEEQRRIAKVLSLADGLRQKARSMQEELDALAQSLFLDMFGDPIANSNGYPVNSIDRVCKKVTDGTHHSPPPQASGIPYITAKHLKLSGLNFDLAPTFVSEEDHRAIYSRCNPEKGDVLYIKDGATTGIAAINPYNFEFSMLSSLALLKVNPHQITSRYLCDWLNHPVVKLNNLRGVAGAAITRLTIKKIKALLIPVPPLEKQIEYEGRRTNLEDCRKQLGDRLGILDTLFNSLLQKAFKGELTFNEAAFENLERELEYE